jgi:sugar-specific transcriptional regulator TrmB
MDTIQDYKILYSNLLLKYEKLKEEYELKINELKEHLKKYTAPSRNKKYYENHRDEIIQKSKEYKEKTGNKKVVSPEKIKEYNKKAYEKRKLKKLENI